MRAPVDRAAARRAAGLVAGAVVVAVVCTLLGLWQWSRHETRVAEVAVVESNFEAEPVPLDAVLDSPGAALADDDVWRPVRVTGHYLAEAAVLLRNRPVNGRPAYHVLVPFVVDRADGTEAILVVDRGAITTDGDAEDAPPPRGTVDLVVRLRADEPASTRDAPAGQVQAISVEQVLRAGGVDDALPAHIAYGALVSEDPAADVALGPLPRPSTDPGSHLSYALQWWTFALGSLIGFTVLARRELTAGTDDSPGAGPAPPRRRRTPSAEDVEDALIDAQLR